jgi:hypothetical protein
VRQQCGGKAQSHIIEDQLSFNAHSNQDGQLAEHWEVADFTTLARQQRRSARSIARTVRPFSSATRGAASLAVEVIQLIFGGEIHVNPLALSTSSTNLHAHTCFSAAAIDLHQRVGGASA